MRSAFVISLFLALPVFATSLAARDNCPPPITCPPEKICPPTGTCPQFCSKCPRTDNAGHPLQAEFQGAAYTNCQYKDTDCFYGPFSSSPDSLAFSFPVGACPTALGANVCSDRLPPVEPTVITTRCPGTNQAVVQTPLRSQINNGPLIECHYSDSECYYNIATGTLEDGPSIPKATPSLGIVAACRPSLVEEHSQLVF